MVRTTRDEEFFVECSNIRMFEARESFIHSFIHSFVPNVPKRIVIFFHSIRSVESIQASRAVQTSFRGHCTVKRRFT